MSLSQESAPKAGAGTAAHRLCGARSESAPAPTLDELNRSLPVDARLWREDIEGSRAWVQALVRAGVLTAAEGKELDAGLLAVAQRLAGGIPADAADEDIHTLVERMLYEEIGELAGKLHTGRSRNDQVATDSRLWAMRACKQIDFELRALQSALLDQAHATLDLLMPSYTHLRRAQPVRVAHWLLSHFWALQRDRERLLDALDRVQCPSRSAAAPLPVPVFRSIAHCSRSCSASAARPKTRSTRSATATGCVS